MQTFPIYLRLIPILNPRPQPWPVPELLLPEFRYVLLDDVVLHVVWQTVTLVVIQRPQPLHLVCSFFSLDGLLKRHNNNNVHNAQRRAPV